MTLSLSINIPTRQIAYAEVLFSVTNMIGFIDGRKPKLY